MSSTGRRLVAISDLGTHGKLEVVPWSDGVTESMNYRETFITVAPDCPVQKAVVPTGKGESKPVHVLQYELLVRHPYTFTGEELLFQTHVRRLGLAEAEVEARREELWRELFSKPHACLRASALAKKYGWGFHYDGQGRIAVVAMESVEYNQMSTGAAKGIKVLPAMRSKRG